MTCPTRRVARVHSDAGRGPGKAREIGYASSALPVDMGGSLVALDAFASTHMKASVRAVATEARLPPTSAHAELGK
jgi:hypothetical protein